MKSFAILITFALAFGCAKKAENANVETNSNVVVAPTVSHFSEITDAEAALAEGNRLLDDNQTELAIEAYKRAVEINPGTAEAYFKMGVGYALIEKEQLRAGAADFVPGEVTSKNPAKPNSEKMFEQAVTAYKKIIAASPNDASAHFNLGRAYNKLNKDKEAEESLAKAVKRKPDDTEYQTELGGIRIKLAQYHEALGPLKKALELDPDNSQAAELLEDAEAGAKRVDFNQPDNTNTIDNKKGPSRPSSISNSSANSNTAASNSNTPVKPTSIETKPKKEEPKDKKLERPTPKPVSTRH